MSCEYLGTIKSYDLGKFSTRPNKGTLAIEIMRLCKLCLNNTRVETLRTEEIYASAVKAFAYFMRQVGVILAWRYNWWQVFHILRIQWD